MKLDSLHTLPIEVQDFIWETISDVNYAISDKFSLNFVQFEFFNVLEDEILLKEKNIIDLPKELEKMPGKFTGDFRKLALQMAIEIFWPLQDYLGGVDRLILRLGGKVPRAIALKKKVVKEGEELEGVFQGKVKDLIKKYKDFKDLRVTPNKIFNKKGRKVNASVQNWVEDYVHFLGAGRHSSLQRVRYISKSPNTIKLSAKHKDSLRFLLLSYDEGVSLYFNKSEGLLNIEEHKEKKQVPKDLEDSEMDLDKLLLTFKEKLKKLEEALISDSMIMSEAENDINKVRDILWNAVGMGDKDKAIACLRLLVMRKSFDAMIKEDSRFKSILRRFIGVKYGQSMEKSWDQNIDQLIARRIFLEMILAEKLKMPEENIFVAAFYLTNIIPDSGQIIYLDKKDQEFKWRNIQVLGNKFAWVDKI
jgi:hypothetical protein